MVVRERKKHRRRQERGVVSAEEGDAKGRRGMTALLGEEREGGCQGRTWGVWQQEGEVHCWERENRRYLL